jgi:glycogen operon protein
MADNELAAFTARLSRLRKRHPSLSEDRFLIGEPSGQSDIPDVVWLHPDGREMTEADWSGENRTLGMQLFASGDRTLTWINGAALDTHAWVPPARDNYSWILLVDSSDADRPPAIVAPGERLSLPPRSVRIYAEQKRD